MRFVLHFLLMTSIAMASSSLYAQNKIKISDLQSKIATLQDSMQQTVAGLKKSNAQKDISGQIKELETAISTFQNQLNSIDEGGEIYNLTMEYQETLKVTIKQFEDKIRSGTLTPTTIKGFESLIKRQRVFLDDSGTLLVDMSQKAARIRAKLKELSSNKELIVASMLVDDQEAAMKELKNCLSMFDAIEKDIDQLNKNSQKMGEARPD